MDQYMMTMARPSAEFFDEGITGAVIAGRRFHPAV
jgi:hypothetical protein